MNAQNCAAYKGQDTYYCIKKHEGWSRLDFLSENGCVVYIDFSFNDFRIYYFPVKLSLPFLLLVFLHYYSTRRCPVPAVYTALQTST